MSCLRTMYIYFDCQYGRCHVQLNWHFILFCLFSVTTYRTSPPQPAVRRGQHTHCSASKCYDYPEEEIWVHSVCVISLRNTQFPTQTRREMSLMGWISMAGYELSAEQGVFEMQRLAQRPVHFNRVCKGTNQELRVGIYFKSPPLRIRRGILSGWKKGNCLRFPDYPLQKLIICLKVLKESSWK